MNDPVSQEEIIFEAASQLSEPHEQAAYLERACGSDHELRQRVERLLRAGRKAKDFFQKHNPAAVIIGDQDAAAKGFEEGAGSVIGRYKLLQKLGEGGMGVVYMAQQEEPVRRRAALKIIKLGMDTKQVVARFEAERQALALMDHPNIARVLDGGATETGRPYFVMELVQGVPITEFCDKSQLSTEQRLKLFIPVCQAIQSAHQKGIIHRDLKPTNILVALNPDGSGFPKIIDFGVAKATSQNLTEKTLFTAHGVMVGTPAYMSPEQAEMSNLDIDTRADIYSLGALLYELLTGSPPFPEQRLRSAGYNEMQRIILEEQPVKPSTRLSTLQGEQRSIIARNRGASELTLGPALPSDLDWIVMKCLEKDRARRYETVNGLARDLERHLRNEPITARPPSRLYEFQKTVRRHWVGFSAVAAVVLALGIGTVVSTLEAVRARRSERATKTAQASEAKQRTLAEQRLYEAKLAEARAKRVSGVAGQRFESLEAISEAAAIRRSPELSDEAIASLALTDLRVQRTFQFPTRWVAENAHFDDRLEQYAYYTEAGISVRRSSNGQQTALLPLGGGQLSTPSLGPLLFDPTGRYLATSGLMENMQRHWRIWDLRRNGACVLDLVAGSLAFSPATELVAASKEDGKIWLHYLDSSQQTRSLDVGVRLGGGMYFSPDGTRIAGLEWEGSVLRIWSVTSGDLVWSLPGAEEIDSVAWSYDSSLLACGNILGGISIWDVHRGQLRWRLEGHRGSAVCLAFDHAGGLLASAGWDGTIRLWDVANPRQLVVYPAGCLALRFSPDDQTLSYTTHVEEGSLLEVARPIGYRRLMTQRLGGACGLDFSGDGRLLATASSSGVWLFDAVTGRELGRLSGKDTTAVHFDSASGSFLYSVNREGIGRMRLVFGPQGETLSGEIQGYENVYRTDSLHTFAFDRALRRVGAIDDQGLVLLDLQDTNAPSKVCVHDSAAFVAMAPSGQYVATGTWRGHGVKVWEFSTGRLLRDLPVPESANVAFSPDGKWLGTASERDYRLWDTASWSPLPQVVRTAPAALVGQLAFTPDSRLLATSDGTREIQIVTVPALLPVARLVSPIAMNVCSLRFTPDGANLAAQEVSGEIHIWDLRAIRSELKKRNLDWDLPPFADGQGLAPASAPRLFLNVAPFTRRELARTIPPRDTNAPANLIDLSAYYNAPLTASWQDAIEINNDLSELPRGLQTFAGVTFDVRGLIQIRAEGPNAIPYPTHVHGVPIGRSCQRLHFLHAAAAASGAHKGDELGSYIVHYVDGGQVEIPIVVGNDLADWWTQSNETNMNFVVAWTGQNPFVRKYQRTIRLFSMTWENPHPNVAIRQFDFVSDKPSPGQPFLVALTAEP